MSDSKDGVLVKALEWVIDIDVPAIRASVHAEREQTGKTNRQLAEAAFSRARWKATAAGVLTGLPSNPWVSVGTATVDVAVTLKTEVLAAARTAIIYDEKALDTEDAAWELLFPVFGFDVASQALRELGVRGGMGVSRRAIKKYLSKETLKVFKKFMLKYFGIKVTQKGIISKTLPIVGGAIGGIWNYFELSAVKWRTIRYFETGPGNDVVPAK